MPGVAEVRIGTRARVALSLAGLGAAVPALVVSAHELQRVASAAPGERIAMHFGVIACMWLAPLASVASVACACRCLPDPADWGTARWASACGCAVGSVLGSVLAPLAGTPAGAELCLQNPPPRVFQLLGAGGTLALLALLTVLPAAITIAVTGVWTRTHSPPASAGDHADGAVAPA